MKAIESAPCETLKLFQITVSVYDAMASLKKLSQPSVHKIMIMKK